MLPPALQPPLAILVHILSYTKLSINDYNGVCGVNKQWCTAATSVPSATVQFIHNVSSGHSEPFGSVQWRATLDRSSTIVTSSLLLDETKRWITDNPTLSSQPIKMSPYLLAIRKYSRVSSFYDFTFTKELVDLLPPNSRAPEFVNGDMGTPVYTGHLLLQSPTAGWQLSMLRSLVLRSNDCSDDTTMVTARDYMYGDDALSAAYVALESLIRHLAKDANVTDAIRDGYGVHESLSQLQQIAIVPQRPICDDQWYMTDDRYHLSTQLRLFRSLTAAAATAAVATAAVTSSTSSTSSFSSVPPLSNDKAIKMSIERTCSIWSYNGRCPVICPDHSQRRPVVEIVCALCHEATRTCCASYAKQTKYYACNGKCGRAPVCVITPTTSRVSIVLTVVVVVS